MYLLTVYRHGHLSREDSRAGLYHLMEPMLRPGQSGGD